MYIYQCYQHRDVGDNIAKTEVGDIIAENIAILSCPDNITIFTKTSRYYRATIENVASTRNRPEIKPKFDFFSLILQVKCGVWREKEKEASLPSTKDEEE
jgi:hypothetical protein